MTMKQIKIRGMESAKVFSQEAEKLTDFTIVNTALNGFQVNGWVRRCIEIIQSQVSSPPWIVLNADGDPVDDHPVARTINFPNAQVTRAQMFDLLVAWLELVGIAPHSFGQPINSELGKGKRDITLISPDRIRASTPKVGTMIYDGFKVDLSGSGSFVVSSDFTIENTVIPRYADPASPAKGIGTLVSAALAVDQDTEQSKWNVRLMQNKGRVEDVFTTDKDLDKKQGEEIRDSIFERIRGRIRSKIGMPLVLGSGMKYTRMGLTAQEVDFVNSRKFNREEIFGVFGVPVQLSGSQEASTFNNFNSAMRVLWEMKIFDVLNTFRDQWNLFFTLSGELADGEFLTYDTSRITALRDDEEQKAKTAETYFKIGIPVEQINTKLNLGYAKYEGWELPFNGKPLVNVPITGSTNNNRHDEQVINGEVVTAILENTSPKEYFLLRADDDREIAQEAVTIRQLSDENIAPIFDDMLSETETNVFALFDRNVFDIAEIERAVVAPQDEDFFREWNDANLVVALGAGESVIVRSSFIYDNRAEEDLTNATQAAIVRDGDILKELGFINPATVDAIMEQVRDFVENDKTIAQLKQAIQDTGILDPIRSLRIARTVGANMASIGQVANASQAGANFKEWMVTGDVRQIHDNRSGEIVAMDQRFSVQVGSTGPRHPADVDIAASDRINCRCFLSFSR